jgi:hypothetical protein
MDIWNNHHKIGYFEHKSQTYGLVWTRFLAMMVVNLTINNVQLKMAYVLIFWSTIEFHTLKKVDDD